MLKQSIFKFFSSEILNRTDYYLIPDGDDPEGMILNLKLLAEEAQHKFNYPSDKVHDWSEEWFQQVLNLDQDFKPKK